MATSDLRQAEITVIEGRNLAKLGNFACNDRFQVKILFGNLPDVRCTRWKKRQQTVVLWNEDLRFPFSGPTPEFVVEVHGKSSWFSGARLIGRYKASHADPSLNGTPETGSDTSFTCDLCNDDKDNVGKVYISTKITSLAVTAQRADVEGALASLRSPNIPSLPQPTGVDGDTLAPVWDVVSPLLKGMDVFADLIGVVSEIHPYAKAAWSILDCARQVVKAQVERDHNLRGLAEQMNSLYDRVLQVVRDVEDGPSKLQDRHRAILLRVARQANECAYFIVDYCKDDKFSTRVIKSIVSDMQKKIEEYQSAFAGLTAELDGNVRDGTQMVVTLIWQDISDLKDDVQVNQLSVVPGASLVVSDSSPKQCFPGTRLGILDEIMKWINGVRDQDQRLLVLHGLAGTGKSSIAHTIAGRFDKLSRLGASFAFNRSRADPPRVNQLFPHIASLLAALHPGIKKHLSDTLATTKDILASSDLVRQFTHLIVKPLSESQLTGPITIVIDALDEADEDIGPVAGLAAVLSQHCGQLPSNVRVLITCRPEPYILDQVQSVLRLSMPDSSKVNIPDVGVFVREQLLSRPLTGIDGECCDKLAETSQGLFQWAATACKAIRPPLPMGSTSRKGYEMAVRSGVGRDKSGLLDSLYSDVLKRIGDSDKNRDGYELLMKVIAVLFALMEPMSLDAFRALYKNLEFGEESDVDSTLPYLASILDGISDRTRPVQPNHTSLRDFFLDPERSGSFCVKDVMPGTHDCAARGSFKIMSTSLPHACALNFARVGNDEYVISEADRVQREMPPTVEYATLHGVKHLALAPTPEEAFWTGLQTSFLTDDRALPWIIVFCLLAIHRLRHTNSTSLELSGCMGLLAHIAKRPGSLCPPHIQSVVQFASTILVEISDYSFHLGLTLDRLGQIYEAVAWTVKLQRQPEDGAVVTIGTGFVLRLDHASHDVILTAAHGLLNDDGLPYSDLVVRIPNQVPRVNGASRFGDDQFRVLSSEIHVCGNFSRGKQLQTAWAAIRLPRGTTVGHGFPFKVTLEDPDTVSLGIYGQLSWLSHHIHLPIIDSNTSADVMHIAVLADPVRSGAPISTFDGHDVTPTVRGIYNPAYGDNAYTKLTPALTRELGSWLGLGFGKSNIQLRWLSDSPDHNSLYLYVDAGEGSRLYLKHGSGSSFNPSENTIWPEWCRRGRERPQMLRFGPEGAWRV